MNMRSFGLPEPEVQRVVKRLALGNGMPMDMVSVLIADARSAEDDD